MPRFGLSPYGNPVEAGIDAFAKVTGVFQNMDKMKMDKESLEMERQDKAQHRQLVDVEMQEKTQDIEMKKQKFKEEVEKAGKLREEDQREAEVVDKINKAGLKGSEAQNTYYTEMRKAGTIKTAKELKEGSGVLFKVPKLTGHIVPDDNSDTGFSFLTEEQGLVPGAPDPDARVNKQITAQGERQDKQIAAQGEHQDKELRAMGARQDKTIAAQSALVDKKESIKEKKDAVDKTEKKYIDILEKNDEYKGKPQEIITEAKRLAKLEKEGKPLTPTPETPKRELSQWMKDLGAENDFSGIENAIKDAVVKGNSIESLRAEAQNITNKEKKAALIKAIDKSEKDHPGTKIQPRAGTKVAPSKDKWMAAARAKNKGVSDKDLEDYYNKKYGSK